MLALGVHGMTVICAVTAQNSVGVQGYWELPKPRRGSGPSSTPCSATSARRRSRLGHARASPVLVGTVCDALTEVAAPVVVDPVAVSKHGDSLLSAGTLEAVRDRLLPLATVVTPNLLEAELLTGTTITDEAHMLAAAAKIIAMGPQWVLVKGGHLPGSPVDLLFDGAQVIRFPGERIDSVHTHGTGCTLASAIASRLALGDDVPSAVKAAKAYVTGAIAAGFPLGAGIGPVDHGWRLRAGVGSADRQ